MKTNQALDTLILTVRNHRVILDADLAGLYSVTTKALNQALKRNENRFPPDFAFQLEAQEWAVLKSQIVTSNTQVTGVQYDGTLRRSPTSGSGGRRTLPYVFTEHGALMAANVLNCSDAISMSLYVVRAFIKQREIMSAQVDILKRLAQMDTKLLQHDDALRTIWRELQPLLKPDPTPPKPQIGFHQKG